MIFKVTEYFKYTRNRLDRVEIRDDWILKVITQPKYRGVNSQIESKRLTK